MEPPDQQQVVQLQRPEGLEAPSGRRFDHTHRVNHESLNSLKPGGWLDDGVINTFFSSLCLARPGRYFAFDSTALESLRLLAFDQDLTSEEIDNYYQPYMTRAATVTGSRGLLFMPFCVKGNHWILVVLDFKQQVILVYDSMASRDKRPGEMSRWACLAQPIQIAQKFAEVFGDQSGWSLRLIYIPIKPTVTECGVFICLMALHQTDGYQLELEWHVRFFPDGSDNQSYALSDTYWLAGRKIIFETCRRYSTPGSDDSLRRLDSIEAAIDQGLWRALQDPLEEETPHGLTAYRLGQSYNMDRIKEALTEVIKAIEELGSEEFLRRDVTILSWACQPFLSSQGEVYREEIVNRAKRYAWHDPEAARNFKEDLNRALSGLVALESHARSAHDAEDVQSGAETEPEASTSSQNTPRAS
ncbi:hypothetical protein J7T55_006113 [Diaporthe amygdali]|uniref:uncharacterized protein n=1 Tax=Phomopsis amygdali TaxID=1214568 RepID=UPI0022FDEEBA|nr:uncharacterized protein J7T55_006113 [Diaporthe amygdali]KAJ0124772.1 hypothetical protein J7T55_006113 [Diaporthe amygdali]